MAVCVCMCIVVAGFTLLSCGNANKKTTERQATGVSCDAKERNGRIKYNRYIKKRICEEERSRTIDARMSSYNIDIKNTVYN